MEGYCQAPPVFDWQQSLGGSSYDAATKIFMANDGGYLLVGTTNSNNGNVSGNHGLSDVWVVKLDPSGAFQWQHCYGGNKVDAAVSAVQMPDGKIFVLASANSDNGNVSNNHGGNANTSDVWLFAINSTGSLLWQKTFGGSAADAAHALIKTSDNNLLIGAGTESTDGDVTGAHGNEDFWLLKVDTAGNLLWQKAFGGTGTDICNTVIETADGFLAAGSSTSNNCDVTGNRGGADYWIVKTDFSGNLVWEKSYGGTSNESAFSAITDSAGNFVICGYTSSSDSDVIENHGSSEFWLLQLDTAGNKIMQATFGGSNSDIAFSIIKADEDGYLLAGTTSSIDFDLQNSQTHGNEDCWLMKSDLAGNIIWTRAYGGSNSDRALSVLQTDDGGYVMAGYSHSNDGQVNGNHGGNDLWVAKLSCLTPHASFTFADDTVCVGLLVNFSNTSTQTAAYSWLADGIPFNISDDASFQFISAGTYEISLAGATCYANDTATHTFIVVNPPVPVVSQDAAYICSGGSISLTTQYAESYLWLPDSLTTSSIQISHGGDYSVQISYHQCISTSQVLQVIEYASPVVELGNDTSFCLTTTFTLHSPAGYIGYLWQNGSTDTAFYATTGGLFYLTVSSAYCSTTDSINLTVQQCNLAIANFSASQTVICENGCLNFTDLSAFADSWEWHFPGSGTPVSTDQNPTNICYSFPGTYEVELIVANSYGRNGLTRTNYITVNANPQTPFVIVNGFWLSSSVASAGYQWFLNGNTIPGATLQSYSATADGFYSVLLDNGTGCTSISDPVYANITSVNDVVQNTDVALYPVPAKEYLTVSNLPVGLTGMELIDITGKIVWRENNPSMDNQLTISTINLESGIYFLKINSEKGTTDKKVVISR
ncbi:MAG: T9SS type A sorting domain-containing protein [Bacteroidota bacterium]